MKKYNILDCTLRDGGCVNNFEFGEYYMRCILHALEESKVDIIELGYIDSAKGSEKGRTQFVNERVIIDNYALDKKPGITYVAMTDYGKYDPNLLTPYNPDGIDGIRLAFHKKDRKNMIALGRTILEKGYKLFVQPMLCMRYSDTELLDLIKDVNDNLPEATALYIVDSFGEMRTNDLKRIVYLFDNNLKESISIGFHSHNNLQLSYANAITLLGFETKRNLIFDSSIMGMGKGAGNMNTELFIDHLNVYKKTEYNTRPLFEVVDNVLNQIREEYKWGYAIEYYLSAINHCTASYAGHFYNKHTLTVNQVAELLGKISEDKKISFDPKYAEDMYFEYNAKKYDDVESLEALKKEIGNKKVVLIGPGKSISKNLKSIREYLEKEDVISISMNNILEIKTDYMFISKKYLLDLFTDLNHNVITTSNVSSDDKFIPVNYAKWTDLGDGNKSDSALIILSNVLKDIGVTHLVLAGCDGFSVNIDENYSDDKLKRPVSKEQAEKRNARAKFFLQNLRKSGITVEFLTPSLYQ